jgi:GT2 family glycosyltransferase
VDVSFIIVSWNTRALLLDCLSSILSAAEGFTCEIFVVDNGSADGSPEAVRRRFGNRVRLIENRHNQGFARANNQALRKARGRYYLLLNSDTVIAGDTLKNLLGFLDRHPDAAMVGPRMVGGDGSAQNSYDNFPGLATELLNKSLLRQLFPDRFSGRAAPGAGAFEVDSLIGACIAVRADAVREAGLLDEDYFFFLEETDWCLRMRKAGWKIYHDPDNDIIHLQGQSKRRRPARAWIEYYRSLYLFFKKNRTPLSYRTLRLFRAIKLPINLALNVVALACTLGRQRRYREKTIIYAYLLWWHLRLCPDSMGLRDTNR